ncbi:hypothetical protein O181_023596 [Austropuccinia psidii MF-1]|uniref:Uncharacterized protein n=1 Tax=Austropuccinia psidii MF-1 TaxID=1389203 RepID=A0A9Q3GXT4_9BASI|nr:hypothetical protein [Austropuccinia psidii MF-1]
MLEKGWNPRLPAETLRKDFIYIHLQDSSLNLILYKVKHYARTSIDDAFECSKQRWDQSHKVPDFKLVDLPPVSILNLNNIQVPKKLQDSYIVDFFIVALHGTNVVQVQLSGELENKNPLFSQLD